MSYNDSSYSLLSLGQTIEVNNGVKTIDRYKVRRGEARRRDKQIIW